MVKKRQWKGIPIMPLRLARITRRFAPQQKQTIEIALLLAFLLVSGCAIAPYDQKTDDSLTQIQTDTDGYISAQKAKAPTLPPATQPAFYAQTDAEFHSLLLRTESREGSDPSVAKEFDSITALQKAVDGIWTLEVADPGKPLPPEMWADVERSIDSAITAALQLELSRKTK